MRWILILILAAMSGCAGLISTANIRDVTEPVLARHDVYIEKDTSLLITNKQIALLQSQIVREQLLKKEVPVGDINPPLQAVMARHDKYIAKDKELPEPLSRVYLRSTTILRDVLKEAKNE